MPFLFLVPLSYNLLNNSALCGERGIRTPGGVTLNGFQDRRIRPLCHLSLKGFPFVAANINLFINFPYHNKCFLSFSSEGICGKEFIEYRQYVFVSIF